MKLPLLVLATLSLTTACSKIDNFEKRADSMNDSTQKMRENLETMYQQQRSAMSLRERNDAFDLMLTSKGINTKISGASMYMQSFEFQHLTDNSAIDSSELRKDLYNDAIDEFSARLRDVYSLINPKDMSLLGTPSDGQLNFYALGAVLHVKHHFQINRERKDSKIETSSVLELITTAFMKEQKGQNLERYENTILSRLNRKMYLDLLRARMDVLTMNGLVNLTEPSISEDDSSMKLMIASDVNTPTIVIAEGSFGLALLTKNFLKNIRTNDKLDANLVAALKSMGTIQIPSALHEEKSQSKMRTVQGLINLLTEE